jgi:probable DNA repair protein
MIQWASSRIATGETRIGLVIPDLQTQSLRLQRLLKRHLSESLFNISLGQPLIDYPLVAHALQWLRLDKQLHLSHHQARLLLHSPYLSGSQTECLERALVMQDSKVLQETHLSISALMMASNQAAPKLAELLGQLSVYPIIASPAEWVQHFKHRLLTLGFPGEYPLHSCSYQCFQRFITLLDELLPLSLLNPMMTQQEAWNALNDMATSTIFQTQTSTTPIQVLGLLEASGCHFDSLWVSGLTDQCLPQKTNISAFIPLTLQREHMMPHASVERELQWAEQVLNRLQNGSKNSVFSYPCLTGDSPNLPSPLIQALSEFMPPPLPTPKASSHQIERQEDYLVRLTTTEPIRGGAALLANQAKCPFRAFATHRLHATSLPQVSDGPNAQERGQLMHRILEVLWQDLGGQKTLLSCTPEALHQRIERAILSALSPLIMERSHSFPSLIQEVEIARLHRLINACMDWEKKRPSFVVEALEQRFTLSLGGIDVHLRIDRLDTVASGKKWVIDYKSHLPINKPWHEERPEEPQLLLYALLDNDINGLLFLQMKAGRILCHGLSEEEVPLQGINTLKSDEHWSLLQQKWHQQLTQLATEFQSGHCPPTPQRRSTCQNCNFPQLCRMKA